MKIGQLLKKIFVEKDNFILCLFKGARLLGGCVYYAEYGKPQ